MTFYLMQVLGRHHVVRAAVRLKEIKEIHRLLQVIIILEPVFFDVITSQARLKAVINMSGSLQHELLCIMFARRLNTKERKVAYFGLFKIR